MSRQNATTRHAPNTTHWSNNQTVKHAIMSKNRARRAKRKGNELVQTKGTQLRQPSELLRVPVQKNANTDHRAYYKFNTDTLLSDDGEFEDDSDSDSDLRESGKEYLATPLLTDGLDFEEIFSTPQDFEGKSAEELRKGRPWFECYLEYTLRKRIREPDWSFGIMPDELMLHSMSGLVLVDGKPEWTSPMEFSKETYEYFATHSPNYVLGFRLVKEYYSSLISSTVYVEIKPKIRYKAIRHELDHALHRWTRENQLDAFESTGPMGTYNI